MLTTMTKLRKGELASLTVGQLVLDAEPAFLVLDAADEKEPPRLDDTTRADLAADLRQWLAVKAKAAQDVPTVTFDPNHRKPAKRHQGEAGGRAGHVLPMPAAVPTLPADTLVSPCRPGWCVSLTGTCGLRGFRSGTNGAGRLTYTPCGTRSAPS